MMIALSHELLEMLAAEKRLKCRVTNGTRLGRSRVGGQMGLASLMRGMSNAGADLEINKLRCANWHREMMAVEDHTSVVL